MLSKESQGRNFQNTTLCQHAGLQGHQMTDLCLHAFYPQGYIQILSSIGGDSSTIYQYWVWRYGPVQPQFYTQNVILLDYAII